MSIEILLIIITVSMIQSIFGVGMLLVGTPLLLLLDYNFLEALKILLPISISISTIQLIKHHELIDFEFVKNVLRYTVPAVIAALILIGTAKINISLVIGIFLIIVALKDMLPQAKHLIHSCLQYEKPYLVVMGLVHGLSNSGGSLLTAIVHNKNYPKNQARATIAICYGLFAIFQFVTLLFLKHSEQISNSDNAMLLQIAIIVFVLTDEFIYEQLDNEKYAKIFTVFLLFSGVLLISKSL